MTFKIISKLLLGLFNYVFLTPYLNAQVPAYFGQELPILKKTGIGPCSDVAISDGKLYAIGNGTIYAFDITTPHQPVLLDSLSGLGNARQIEVQEGFAYITSREEGMFIVNIEDPGNMALWAHYDTLELGTGIAVSGPVAAVANRQYGVELIDVSDRKKPRFLGAIRTGEAQSVFIQDTLLFAGNWGEQSVSICNISDPTRPRLLSETPLDGFGDGIFVRGNLCYAATGHHARGFKKLLDPDDPAFGKGHGLEILDITNPAKPVKLSTIKLPIQYQRYYDCWDVQVSGDFAFVGDTHSGIFVINISDPRRPFFVAQRKLPLALYNGLAVNDPVYGFALGMDHIYAAGKLTDLYVINARKLAKEVMVSKPQSSSAAVTGESVKPPHQYKTEGSVHSAFLHPQNGSIFVAAGNSGVHRLQLKPALKGKEILNTGNVVFDVAVAGNYLYLAEGIAGFSVWEYPGNTPPLLVGRYKPSEGGVYQILINPNQKNAALHVGKNVLDIVDITHPENIGRKIKFEKNGPFYRLPFSLGLINQSIIVCKWHGIGYFMYDLNEEKKTEDLIKLGEAGSLINGLAFYKNKTITLMNNDFLIQEVSTKGAIDKRFVDTREQSLRGKLTVFGEHLYVSNKMTGEVSAWNINNIESPQRLWKHNLSGNPGLILKYQDAVIIPAGRDGLLVYNAESGAPFYRER